MPAEYNPSADEDINDFMNSLRYFWEDKRDLERYFAFDRELLKKRYPEVLDAWDRYKTAERSLSAIFRGIEE